MNHFDENYFAGKQWHLAGLEHNERYYGIAKRQFEQAGRRIIDATVDGKCKVRSVCARAAAAALRGKFAHPVHTDRYLRRATTSICSTESTAAASWAHR